VFFLDSDARLIDDPGHAEAERRFTTSGYSSLQFFKCPQESLLEATTPAGVDPPGCG
jgi:hypothetical protein